MNRFFTALAVSALAVATASAQPGADGSAVVETPVFLQQPLDLPQMGEPADAAMSPSQEAALGARVVSQLYQYEYILEDPQIAEYVSSVGWRLAGASATRPPNLQFFVIKDPRINAFALPGGFIGINAGLIMASSSESEMAGVMGHELAHVTQRHIARSADAQGGLPMIATWAAVLAAIIAGSADPDVIMAALSVGQAASYQRQVNFTRDNEKEADRIGIQTMATAGFNPEGMASFFQRLEQQSRLYGSGVPEILRTHPVNTNRIAEARARIALMPKSTYKDPIDYSLMQARTLVFAADQPSQALEMFSAQIAANRDTPGNQYGLAMALNELGQNDRAEAILKPLLDKNPKQANLSLLMAKIQLGARKTDLALATYKRTLEQYPRFSPAILEYAEALIACGHSDQARQVLLSHEQSLGTQLDTYRLLAQSANELNNKAEASYQMANFLYLRGDPGGALAQLDAGLRNLDLDQHDRARLAARRAEVREALPRNYDPRERERQRR